MHFVDKSESMRTHYSGQRSKFPLESRTLFSGKKLLEAVNKQIYIYLFK